MRSARRVVLARRRLLAAMLAAVAVAAALRVAAPPPTPARDVPVAARDLATGAVLKPGDLSLAAVPVALVPPRVAAEPVGRVLAGPLDAGETLTETRLVGEAMADQPAGRVAVPVRVADAAMAALLRVGDRIDLLATDLQGAAAGGARPVAVSVPVLAVPAPGGAGGADGGLGAQPSGRLVVVAVPQTAVGEVAGSSAGSYLTFAWSSP